MIWLDQKTERLNKISSRTAKAQAHAADDKTLILTRGGCHAIQNNFQEAKSRWLISLFSHGVDKGADKRVDTNNETSIQFH